MTMKMGHYANFADECQCVPVLHISWQLVKSVSSAFVLIRVHSRLIRLERQREQTYEKKLD